MVRLPLQHAIASILGKQDAEGYRNIGHTVPVKVLYKLLGLTNSPMIYHYLSGKTKKIEPERALVIYNTFGVLIDQWLTPEELQAHATNVELSEQIAREPVKEIVDELVRLEAIDDLYDLRKGVRQIIARFS